MTTHKYGRKLKKGGDFSWARISELVGLEEKATWVMMCMIDYSTSFSTKCKGPVMILLWSRVSSD